MKRLQAAALAACVLAGAGCSDVGGLAKRYRAEKMLYDAKHEESRLRVGRERPDSTTLIKIHNAYARVRAAFKPPFVTGSGETSKRLNAEVTRLIGSAELTCARIALEARRADLALEHAKYVSSIAAADTGLARDADFASADALQGLRRFEDAIQTLRMMEDRYPPASPPSLDREDRMLSVPDGIAQLRGVLGDSAGARAEHLRGIEYYRGLLKRSPPPILEAQIRGRLTRNLLELGDGPAALVEVTELKRLISTSPVLKSLEPEIIYSEARIRGMGKDPSSALDYYDMVVMMYPGSIFAPRALMDAGILMERARDNMGALARYRAILERPKPDPALAPLASFRSAMVKDQIGKWAEAKQTLEGIPLQYPESRAALEAPFAIVEHYARAGQMDAARSALVKAVDTFRGLIAADTTSAYCVSYRWNILRAYEGLDRWNDALSVVDEMDRRDGGSPLGLQALAAGVEITTKKTNDKARRDIYLQKIVLEYPKSALAESARKRLGGSASAGGPASGETGKKR